MAHGRQLSREAGPASRRFSQGAMLQDYAALGLSTDSTHGVCSKSAALAMLCRTSRQQAEKGAHQEEAAPMEGILNKQALFPDGSIESQLSLTRKKPPWCASSEDQIRWSGRYSAAVGRRAKSCA